MNTMKSSIKKEKFKEKDLRRQKEIEKFLNCTFIRITDN